MDAVIIDLPKSLDISEINSSYEQFSNLLSELVENTSVTFNAQSLSRVDTAGVQLLVALVVELTTRKININWENTPDELINGANALGLFDLLKLH